MTTKSGSIMSEFTEERIKQLINSGHNWELVETDNGLYFLRQKDKHYMRTISFRLPKNVADKYL